MAPSLLGPLLLPHEVPLRAHGVSIDVAEIGRPGWHGLLHEAVTRADAPELVPLFTTLLAVLDFADAGEAGHDALLAAAGERGISILESGARRNVLDLALALHAADLDAFTGAHDRLAEGASRPLVEYHARSPLPADAHRCGERMANCREALNRHFERTNRGGCALESDEDGHEVFVHVQHGARLLFHRHSISTGHEGDDLITIDTRHGRLRIDCCPEEPERQLFRQVIGRYIYGDPDLFTKHPPFESAPDPERRTPVLAPGIAGHALHAQGARLVSRAGERRITRDEHDELKRRATTYESYFDATRAHDGTYFAWCKKDAPERTPAGKAHAPGGERREIQRIRRSHGELLLQLLVRRHHGWLRLVDLVALGHVTDKVQLLEHARHDIECACRTPWRVLKTQRTDTTRYWLCPDPDVDFAYVLPLALPDWLAAFDR